MDYFKKTFLYIIIFFFPLYINAQINVIKGYEQNKELILENVCAGDSSKTKYNLSKVKKSIRLKNINITNPEIKLYLNDKLLNEKEYHFSKKKGNTMIVNYTPSIDVNRAGSITFDIYKNSEFVKNVKIELYVYSLLVNKEDLESIDTLFYYKNLNCKSNQYMYFPNIGTSTYVIINDSDDTIFKHNFDVSEKVLIDLSEYPIGIYKIDYISSFYIKQKILVIE